jgi:hypothetical protein
MDRAIGQGNLPPCNRRVLILATGPGTNFGEACPRPEAQPPRLSSRTLVETPIAVVIKITLSCFYKGHRRLLIGNFPIAKHVPWLLHLLQQPLLNLVPFSIFCPSFSYSGRKKARILYKITFILRWTKQLSSFTCCNKSFSQFPLQWPHEAIIFCCIT